MPTHPGHAVSVPARLPAQRARLRFTLWPMLAMLSMPYNNNNNYTALQYSALLYYPTTLVLVLYIPQLGSPPSFPSFIFSYSRMTELP